MSRVRDWLTLGALVVGCGTPMSGADGGPSDDAGRDAGSALVDAPVLTDAASSTHGSGEVTGSVNGVPFETVGTAYIIGAPDSTRVEVVYVFSGPVDCADLATPGWDERIPDATSILEMKLFGHDPATFTVVRTVTPGRDEASVNYTLSSTSGTPTETGSGGGTVTLESITPMGPATGAFDLQFASDHLVGRFDAVFCPGGHEP